MKMQFPDLVAKEVLKHFVTYRSMFKDITDEAQSRFEKQQWAEIQQAAADRIDLYEKQSQVAANKLRDLLGEALVEKSLWCEVKSCYIELLQQRNDFELAETFYNSIYCKVFGHKQLSNEHMFVHTSIPGREISSENAVYRTYYMENGLVLLIKSMLADYSFNVPWENKKRDICNLVHYIKKNIRLSTVVSKLVSVDVMLSVFYRNKGAYLVGRINSPEQEIPFVIPILNHNGRVYVDTAIIDQDEVSVIFSFTRAYFMVDVNVPSEFVRFLQSLIPMKSRSELYASIGFHKQGKAEFYRDFVAHMKDSDDLFIIAPGVKGMVMSVFTLESYPVVFKIIKDRFSSSKQITRAMVHEKYKLVKRHDRVGRMADTQEFENFVIPHERFSSALLEELQLVAPSALLIEEDKVTIKHLWIERRMTPLNIYINEALQRNDEAALFHAINEYGKAIKQLAAANIFAGDMLFKNFGVTRHGRVVFYDYDEILYLMDCNFRKIPEAMYPEQEMSVEPWYSVAQNDVFPEEFSILTACNSKVRKIFDELHGDLLDIAFWQEMQCQVRAGNVVDIFPYRQAQRFLR